MADTSSNRFDVERLLNMIRLGRKILNPRKGKFVDWPELRCLPTPTDIRRYCQHGGRALAELYGGDSEPLRRFREESARAFRDVPLECPPGYEAETVEVVDRDACAKTLDTLREAYRHATSGRKHSTDAITAPPSSTAGRPTMPQQSEPPVGYRTERGAFIWNAMKEKGFRTGLELARKAGVDPSSVSRFVRGTNTRPGKRPSKARSTILKTLDIDEAKIPE